MSTSKPDDFDAAKSIVETLEPFEIKEKEKIIRWVCERLGITQQTVVQSSPQSEVIVQAPPMVSSSLGQGKDIKTFLSEKDPKSDIQLAAAIAYYYMFESPQNDKKSEINSTDILNACRLAGLERLKDPGKALSNAHGRGVLDKGSERGSYTINPIGENLVAMTMPSSTRKTTTKSKSNVKKANSKAKKSTGKKA